MIIQYISKIRSNSKTDNIFKFGGSKFKRFENFTITKHASKYFTDISTRIIGITLQNQF